MAQKRISSSQTERKIKQEDLMIAIDQLEQLTEVMGEVLNRVKTQVATLEHTPSVTRKTSSTAKKATPSKTKKRSLVH